ncbi:multiple monosaccharide ABC transporter permease [Anaerotalea alkaliphila]|uniref:Xylose transport system permease protein XylH n=1 Tax=Anaerotalea alkaliphila TaxID=2662126 RepID=A0A7X5HX13_9FIRM|nr:multiple monosaccharide ABC transporter permease [Anaerotalea alkaliphila]NDL68051.1 sugar ABC transporter permease [Anaerotalea alkaliphila]
MGTLKEILKSNIRQFGMIIALVAIMLFFAAYTGGMSLTPLNITNLVLQNSYILILAVGMLLVIVTGNIDLSVGSVAAFIGAVAATLMISNNMNFLAAALISLLIGAGIGALQGSIIAFFKVPAFIVTLGGMLFFRGLTMVVLGGKSLAPFPPLFTKISSGFIPDVLGGEGIHLTTMVLSVLLSAVYVVFQIRERKSKQKYGFEVISHTFFVGQNVLVLLAINAFMAVIAYYRGIPNILILLAVLIVIYAFIMKKTIFGRHIYALGGSEKAAQLSGVKTARIALMVYINMGMLAALSGLVFAARLNSATPKAGQGFELDAIASCFIGGASASGGVGTVVGAIVGGLVMGVMNNGMSLVGLGIDWQQAIKGLVLVLAVLFDIYTKSKN